jgi:small subunit ribosomal protein S18
MSEQTNPTPENQAEETTAPEATSNGEAPAEQPNAPQSSSANRPAAAQPANRNAGSRTRNARDDDDDEYDDDYNYDDYDGDEYDDEYDDEYEDSDEIREIRTSGPADYVPSTQRGRSRRIRNDIRIEDINYKNIAVINRFLDPRGRILSRRKTGVSAKVQRRAVVAIKRARHLALLPFTAEQTRVTRLRRRGG